MVWREEEILTTSIFAHLTHKPHYICVRKHPIETLYRLLFEPELPRIYVSFPISAIIDKPDIVAEIDAFKNELVKQFTVFDPYTIREKRLDYEVQRALKAGRDSIEYEVNGTAITIPISEVESILADIDDQIVARDLMLVEQSQMLVAYYPCYDDGTPIHSGGREREIIHGRDNGKPVYLIWPSDKKEPGPFELDNAAEILRSVRDARDFLVKAHGSS